jgi:chromosomal replication initiator protein dnaA
LKEVIDMDDAQVLLTNVKNALKNELTLAVYNNIFDNLNKIHKVQNDNIYLIVSDKLEEHRLRTIYSKRMNELLNTFSTKKMQFQFITTQDAEAESIKIASNNLTTVNPSERFIGQRVLRPEYTFDNFVTGEANREAFVFSLKVAGSPHETANPFYIFGDVGLGKTHLMMAIGHYMLANNVNLNIVYTTAQQFVEDYFKSKNKNQRSTAISESFDTYYRSADVLLVDDIQYLADRQGSQDEFFKLFEYLNENGKQIIVTSDRKATELNIMDRLKSRFTWGLQADVKKPNKELRKAILKNKLNILINNPEDVAEDALDYIAVHFEENVRELEGALRRFINYCVAFGVKYTLDNAVASLESIIPNVRDNNLDNSNSNIEIVKNRVASYFNINVKELSGTSRKQEIVYARSIAMYLIRTKYNVGLKKIGESLGNRDHSTTAHAISKIEDGIKFDDLIKQDVDNIVDKLNK